MNSGSGFFFIMPRYKITLQDHLKKLYDNQNWYSISTALGWFLGIAKGLAFLKDCHIIHRDIATRNIMLDEYIDFKDHGCHLIF